MAKLEVNLYASNEAVKLATVNDKPLKITSVTNGVGCCKMEIADNKAELAIYKTHHYSSKLWFLTNLIYFIISVFGIFDVRHDKNCPVIDCRYILYLDEETKVNLKPFSFTDGGKVAEITSSSPVKEISNIQYFDKVAQKKHKIMKGVKIALTVLSVIGVILALIIK